MSPGALAASPHPGPGSGPGLVGQGKARAFTIPTDSGPIMPRGLGEFVSVTGGGYFFLPSRSALRHLTELVSA